MPLADLSAEQQQAFRDRLKELQMDPAKVVKSITPVTSKGPVVLSADAKESHVEAHLVTVNSLDDVKRLAGNPDGDYESGKMAEHHPKFELWPEHKNGLAAEELSAEENNRINDAELAYIYGNSKHVKSYKSIIESHKYPATFAVFAVEDICLDASNSPMVIKSESAHNYGTLTICAGGSIKFEANAVLTVQKMVRSNAASCSEG